MWPFTRKKKQMAVVSAPEYRYTSGAPVERYDNDSGLLTGMVIGSMLNSNTVAASEPSHHSHDSGPSGSGSSSYDSGSSSSSDIGGSSSFDTGGGFGDDSGFSSGGDSGGSFGGSD